MQVEQRRLLSTLPAGHPALLLDTASQQLPLQGEGKDWVGEKLCLQAEDSPQSLNAHLPDVIQRHTHFLARNKTKILQNTSLGCTSW